MLKRVLFQVSYQIENNLNQFFNSFFSKQMLIPAYSNIPFNNQLNNNENQNIPSFSELFGDILLMAAPKSRVIYFFLFIFLFICLYFYNRFLMLEKQENI